MTDSGDLRVGICAISKDEGSYLEEWVAYHHLQGYGPIRVYAHACSDNTHAVLARLAKYGLCEWEPFASALQRKPQWIAYEQGMERLRPRTDWIAFIDVDEFLVTPRHQSIQAFLADHGDLGAIAVNRKSFGSSGQLRREPGLVIERFTRCARPDLDADRAVKMLARTDAVEVPRVHTARFVAGTAYRTVLGEVLADHAVRSRRVDHEQIRVNRYTRSLEEWEARSAEGRAAFDAADRNEERDTEVQRWVAPVSRLVAELRATDVDDVYEQLDAEQRRVRQLETEVARLRDRVAAASSRSDSLQVALQAETRRSDALGELVERIAGSTSWRVGNRAVRAARLATLRRSSATAELELPARAAPRPAAPPPG